MKWKRSSNLCNPWTVVKSLVGRWFKSSSKEWFVIIFFSSQLRYGLTIHMKWNITHDRQTFDSSVGRAVDWWTGSNPARRKLSWKFFYLTNALWTNNSHEMNCYHVRQTFNSSVGRAVTVVKQVCKSLVQIRLEGVKYHLFFLTNALWTNNSHEMKCHSWSSNLR